MFSLHQVLIVSPIPEKKPGIVTVKKLGISCVKNPITGLCTCSSHQFGKVVVKKLPTAPNISPNLVQMFDKWSLAFVPQVSTVVAGSVSVGVVTVSTWLFPPLEEYPPDLIEPPRPEPDPEPPPEPPESPP